MPLFRRSKEKDDQVQPTVDSNNNTDQYVTTTETTDKIKMYKPTLRRFKMFMVFIICSVILLSVMIALLDKFTILGTLRTENKDTIDMLHKQLRTPSDKHESGMRTQNETLSTVPQKDEREYESTDKHESGVRTQNKTINTLPQQENERENEPADKHESGARTRNKTLNTLPQQEHQQERKYEESTEKFKIPRRLIFTYKENILETKQPTLLYNNVMHTIQIYSNFWNQSMSEVEVLFLDDQECLKLIKRVEPKLVEPFLLEPYGAYKADICRIAALYVYGGYYFDVDIEALKPLEPAKHVDFISARSRYGGDGGLFQAVLATSPSHPALKFTNDAMIHNWFYNPEILARYNRKTFDPEIFYTKSNLAILVKKNGNENLMGPGTAFQGYSKYLAQNRKRDTTWILEELDNLDRRTFRAVLYNDWLRYQFDFGCNFIVHDPSTKTPYFYSRIIGTHLCPNSKKHAFSRPKKKKT